MTGFMSDIGYASSKRIVADRATLSTCSLPGIPTWLGIQQNAVSKPLPYNGLVVKLPYTLLVGGVFSIRLEHFLAVNGYSNLYWGWGGEDDDMAYRIKYRKLEILRPPETLARYSMIKHDHRPESPNAIRTALLRMAKKRSSRDGLNTVKYRVVWRHEHLAYTHLMVDIGQHHRWQFLNGQRLIINF
ncbi:beta-1,4-N-acetylgalactosaminyltransferase bre-4 [Trichonephila clavipes]|nr:beta-1,4-N-acetylgalactosaminyltransferase bre-4 [Trichonephila clavipes]